MLEIKETIRFYLCKFDVAGRRASTVPIDGLMTEEQVAQYVTDGYIKITSEEWAYYVGNRGAGDNGTGYIRDTKTGKPVSAPPVPTVEEEPQEPPVDLERLAVYEAMAAQEARLVAQAERITALEAALKAKGGDSK